MTTTDRSPATTPASDHGDIHEDSDSALQQLYTDFAAGGVMPLWTQRADLQPPSPQPLAAAACWRWADIHPLAVRAGELVPVGRGGERRALALANPGLPGQPFATPTLWAAIQYLGPREVAPSHHHVQSAFRFVVEGEGVWTNVEGDPVAMRRGDLLLTASWKFHEHHNTTDHPMAWIDGLDIPLVSMLDAGFFEYGPDRLTTSQTPARSRSERLWGHPGLRPVIGRDEANSPLVAYRWSHTDAALADQLSLADEGFPASVEPGHAAIRFCNPSTGADAMLTMRTEMHRLRAGTNTAALRVVGSAVWQVFDGHVRVEVGEEQFDLVTGDLFAVPSWVPVRLHALSDVDLFRFSDEPVYEKLGLARRSTVTA